MMAQTQTPKYRRLKRRLIAEITSGRWSVGG
jgi:hypothetical protein